MNPVHSILQSLASKEGQRPFFEHAKLISRQFDPYSPYRMPEDKVEDAVMSQKWASKVTEADFWNIKKINERLECWGYPNTGRESLIDFLFRFRTNQKQDVRVFEKIVSEILIYPLRARFCTLDTLAEVPYAKVLQCLSNKDFVRLLQLSKCMHDKFPNQLRERYNATKRWFYISSAGLGRIAYVANKMSHERVFLKGDHSKDKPVVFERTKQLRVKPGKYGTEELPFFDSKNWPELTDLHLLPCHYIWIDAYFRQLSKISSLTRLVVEPRDDGRTVVSHDSHLILNERVTQPYQKCLSVLKLCTSFKALYILGTDADIFLEGLPCLQQLAIDGMRSSYLPIDIRNLHFQTSLRMLSLTRIPLEYDYAIHLDPLPLTNLSLDHCFCGGPCIDDNWLSQLRIKSSLKHLKLRSMHAIRGSFLGAYTALQTLTVQECRVFNRGYTIGMPIQVTLDRDSTQPFQQFA